METKQYKTDITSALWWALDLPGNAGWILYLVFYGLCLSRSMGAYALVALVPALIMIVGVVELVRERILKLDRILPKKSLCLGFGALTLGGLAGLPVSLIGYFVMGDSAIRNYMLWMAVGSVLLAAVSGYLLSRYKPMDGK
mgnify:FL=1